MEPSDLYLCDLFFIVGQQVPAVRWTACESVHGMDDMPIRVRISDEWSDGCPLLEQRHKLRMKCKRLSRVVQVNRAGAALMRIGLNIVKCL